MTRFVCIHFDAPLSMPRVEKIEVLLEVRRSFVRISVGGEDSCIISDDEIKVISNEPSLNVMIIIAVHNPQATKNLLITDIKY